jgi:hypothetical protein
LSNESKIKNELNAITVVTMTSYQLQQHVFPLIPVPEVSPNKPADIEGDLVPLLSNIANEASFLAHMQAICVSAKADLEAEGINSRSNDGSMREVKAKIEILDRGIKQSNRNWDAVSRIITVCIERPHSRLRKAGT